MIAHSPIIFNCDSLHEGRQSLAANCSSKTSKKCADNRQISWKAIGKKATTSKNLVLTVANYNLKHERR